MRTFLLAELEDASVKYDMPLSPLSLKGNQDKWYYEKENLVVKAALFDGFIRWEDWKVEVLAGKMLPRFHIGALEQNACKIDDGFGNIIYGSYSRDFRSEQERYYTFGRLLQEKDLTERFTSLSAADKITASIEVLAGQIGEDRAARFVEDMCLADYILGNVDRHYDNFGVLIRRDAEGSIVERRPAPLYDFGMGLFQNQKEGLGDDLEAARNNMLSSPFTIDLRGAYAFYQDRWRDRCRGIRLDLTGLDFPDGLGKQYVQYALASLGVRTEGCSV